MVSIADSAQEAMENMAENQQTNPPAWSDRSVQDVKKFQELKATVEAFEGSDPSALASRRPTLADELYADLVERVADLEARGPRRSLGAAASLAHKRSPKSSEPPR